MEQNNIIIYNTDDGKASVSLLAKDGNVWLNQQLMAELFDTSVPNISMHISNILKDNELGINPVVKDYLTTASDGKSSLPQNPFIPTALHFQLINHIFLNLKIIITFAI
jgi:hypothetical protein